MKYTVRYAHLAKISCRELQKLSRGDLIGTMGSTGAVDSPHLHVEVIEGHRDTPWANDEVRSPDNQGHLIGSNREAIYCIEDVFKNQRGLPCIINTFWDVNVQGIHGVWHQGYDVIPFKEGGEIIWSREWTGTVFKTGRDMEYGNYVLVNYEMKAGDDE